MDIKSVLVVDDSKMARITMKKQIEPKGIEVFLVESGEKSIEFLKDNKPDVIFMDCMMPGIDGFETTSRILENADTATIPIVMCTGKESEEDKRKAFGLGAKGYMIKSSSKEPLNKIIDELKDMSLESHVSDVKNKNNNRMVNEIATSIATKIFEDMYADKVAPLTEQLTSTIDEKMSTLTTELDALVVKTKESMEGSQKAIDDKFKEVVDPKFKELDETTENIINSTRNALEGITSDIDTKFTSIDEKLAENLNKSLESYSEFQKTVMPEFKNEVISVASEYVEESTKKLADGMDQLKAEVSDMASIEGIQKICEEYIRDNLAETIPSVLAEKNPKMILKGMVSEQMTSLREHINTLENMVHENVPSDEEVEAPSNSMSFVAIGLSVVAIGLSVYGAFLS